MTMENGIPILVVDDEHGMRSGLADVLEEKGYQVSTAESGYQALERAKRIPFHLVIADLRMPGLDGVEMIEKLKKIDPGIAIIAMTAYASDLLGTEALKNGAFDCITKPFTIEEMDMAIEKSLRRRELYQEKKQLSEELDKARERLNMMEEQLIRSRRASTVGRLGAGISHEVKNLLGIISVSAHYLKDKLDNGTPKAAKHLENIEREVRRSNEIVVDWLNLCLPATTAARPTQINEVIEEVTSLIEHQLSLQNIETRRACQENLPEVMVNPNEMKHVLINMILNAQDAMPQGGSLKIETRMKDKNGRNYIQIEITDTGCGIPEEIRRSIPEKFLTTKGGKENVGLGLPISYKIIQNYRGWIDVSSEVGKGTTFVINIPVPTAQEDKGFKPEIEQEANTAEEILSLIRSSQFGMTLAEVAIALPHNFEEISGTINKLAGEGKLEKEGKLYKATG